MINQNAMTQSVYQESDFFMPEEMKYEKREKKYVTAQAKAIALVLLLAMIVSGVAALIVTSLAESYSESHKNAAVVTVKYADKQTDADKSFINTAINSFFK